MDIYTLVDGGIWWIYTLGEGGIWWIYTLGEGGIWWIYTLGDGGMWWIYSTPDSVAFSFVVNTESIESTASNIVHPVILAYALEYAFP